MRKPAMTARRADALRAAADLANAEWDAELSGLLNYGELRIRDLPTQYERDEAKAIERRIADLDEAVTALGRYATKGARDAQVA